MEKNLQRRNFLNKLVYSAGSLFLIPFTPIKKLFSNEDESNTTNYSMGKEVILKTSALGFQWETKDPFLFCVHHEDAFPKGNGNMGPDVEHLKGRHIGDDFIIKDGFRMYHGKTIPGFPGHPHRGFETITVVRKGIVDHADSMGAAGRYGNGDVQWMTAGKGVQHSEMFPLVHTDKENYMELFQIWLNLPKKNKMVDPHFKMLWKENIPNIIETDRNGKKTTIEVIAGKFGTVDAQIPPPNSWASNEENEVVVWNLQLEEGAEIKIPASKGKINRTLYFYEGKSLEINSNLISSYHSIDVISDVDLLLKANNSECRILILQGKPINEPVIQYGPFVMNTKQEIQQAFEDYHNTQFGGWPWDKFDKVHSSDSGRFAKHADGTIEIKNS